MIDIQALKAAAPAERFLRQFLDLKKSGPRFVAKCPFHEDSTPSFTVSPDRDRWHCFGCGADGDVVSFVMRQESLPFQEAAKRIAEMVGLDIKPRLVNGTEKRGDIVAIYRYEDENSQTLYEICRIEPGKHGKKKDFLQRYLDESGAWVWSKHPRQVLYRLPEVIAAEEVIVVEGEKDCDMLAAHGFVATTNAGGASAPWIEDFSETLRGKRIIVIPDNDDPGRKHAEQVSKGLASIAAEILVVALPGQAKGFDASDWFQCGGGPEKLLELIAKARETAKREKTRSKGLRTVAEVLEAAEGGLSAFFNPTLRPKGLQTGFTEYDQTTLGLHPGEMVVIAARPAMGKTALVLNIAQNVLRSGKRVSLFSLEMGAYALLQRMACAHSRVDSMRYRHGYLNATERRAFQQATADLAELPFLIDDRSGASVAYIADQVKENKPDLVVVDYLQLMRGSSAREVNRTQEVGSFSRGLKQLAREFELPVIALSQLSRAVESRDNKRPTMADLRDSGEIEQDADLVAFLFREEVYKKDRSDLKGQAELIIAKHRNGPNATINLVWLAGITKFENRCRESDHGIAEDRLVREHSERLYGS